MQGETRAKGLVAAAIALLEADVLPGLTGDARFKTLMALSALRMAERERVLAPRLIDLGPLRERLRTEDAALTPELHAALLRDAVVSTAITKPGALTAEEREWVRLG